MANLTGIVANNSSNWSNSSNCSVDSLNHNTCGMQHHPNRSSIPLQLVITLMILIHIVGLFGNAIVLFIVASKQTMQSYTNWMFLNLACSDLAVVLFCIPLDIPLIINQKWIYGKFFCSVYYPIGTTPLLSSVFTLVSIAYTRYWSIVKPFGKQASVCHAKVTIIVIWAISFVFSVPVIIILRYNSEYQYCYESWKHSSRRIYTITIFLCGYALPLAIITNAYVFIVYEVLLQEKRAILSYRDARRCKENRTLMKLSLVVIVTFAVCILPNQIVFIMYEFGDLAQNRYYVDIRLASNLMLFLNSALNPIIYNVFSETFREEFHDLITGVLRYIIRKSENEEGIMIHETAREMDERGK